MPPVLKVRGYNDLHQTLRKLDRQVRRDVYREIKRTAFGVHLDAERFARRQISRIGRRWWRMRIGVTAPVVYIAPRMRGARDRSRKRRNLARLLAGKAMRPAVRKNQRVVKRKLQRVIDRNLIIFNHGRYR